MRARFEERLVQSGDSGSGTDVVLATAEMHSGDAIDRSTWPKAIEEASCDLVASIFMLHHVYPPKRRAFMRNALAALRPGGWFIFLEGTEEHTWFKPYHDPQDVEALEYFEPFHTVFDGCYLDGITLEEQRYFPPLGLKETDGKVKPSGWAVASVGSIR
jgi:SAM-dependent methyltransferase